MNLIKRIVQEKNVQSFANQIGQALIGFLSFVVLTRTYSKEVFGAWVLYVASSVFIEMFRFGLIRTALVRFLSGARDEEAKRLKASNWVISSVLTLILVVIIVLVNLIFHEPIQQSGYRYFFKWYPVLALLNLPLNNAVAIAQAEQRFDRILFLRLSVTFSFFIFLLINLLWLKVSIDTLIIVNFSLFGVVSLYTIIRNLDGNRYFRLANKETIQKIIQFGKFSTGTLIGSNLLKSADTFIIGLSPFLGTAGVALYSVPLKLTELMEIPLRSFTSTAFPKMSRASQENDNGKVRQLFYLHAGGLTFLFIPMLLMAFLLARYIILIIGGSQYLEGIWIFRMFCIYGLILPIDRFTGVALDSMNFPRLNFYKILWMTGANILGDTLAVFGLVWLFPHISHITVLTFVAMVTILMTIVGLYVGWRFTNIHLNIRFIDLLKEGIKFYKNLLFKFKTAIA